MKGILRFNEPLAPYTSWHIGGPAERYYRPEDWDDLALFLATLPPDEPLIWLGLGSNVLIADEGVKGTVIHTLGMKSSLPVVLKNQAVNNKNDNQNDIKKQDARVIRVEAGIPSAKLAKYCAKESLKGGEFFAGIPGTIGGALAMNAGAFGGETWPRVVAVEVINRRGERKTRTPEEYEVGYRTVKGPKDEWFIAGHFLFETGDPLESTHQIKQLLRKRSATQPIGVFSCGSVFRNPPNDFAARLIEASKLKGFTIGGAQISPKHANFIINTNDATARDVMQLINHIQERVFEDHQIRLHPEVVMVPNLDIGH